MVVTLALTAALCFASASVLQQRAAVRVPATRSLRLGLLTHLARRPLWLAGIAADAAGYALQVLALDRGPLALVQPLLAGGLLAALVFNTSSGPRGLRAQDWAAALAMAAGLAVFVVAGDPRGDAVAVGADTWFLLAVVTVAGVALALVLARRRGPAGRAALLAAGGGIAFGLAAALTKQCLAEVHHGVLHLLRTGFPYGLAVTAVAGMLLAQSAFQAGALAACLPTLTLAEPVFAVGVGVVLFGEHLRPGWPGAAAVIGAIVSGAAVIVLARSPRAQPVVTP